MAIDDNTSYELTGRQVKDLANKVKAKADSASLASVATSGLYSDLTGAPTIPTVYNGTLTIQQNGTTVQTFTANSSTDTTVNIETIYADTVAPATQVAPITTNMIADGAITNGKIASNTITAGKIAAGAVDTSELANSSVNDAKIDGTSVRKMKVLYHYVQANDSSTTTNYDVPVDFSTYKYLELSVVFSTSGTSGADWTWISPLTESKGSVRCIQCGLEAKNTTTLTGINRVNDQLIAARYASGNPTGYEVRFHVGADGNSCIAFARGYGGDEGWQIFNVKVSIDVGIGAVKYLRIPLITPRAGAHITLWGVKGTDMGY